MTDSENAPELYKLVQSESWVKVVQRSAEFPNEAAYEHPTTKQTSLHLAVRAKKSSSGRIASIRALLRAFPQAAAIPDAEFGYTPLAYAILVDAEIESRIETQKNLEDDSEVVRLILEFNPKSLQVMSRDGYSPLELHIMAMSRLKRTGDVLGIRRHKKKARDASSSILNAILKEENSTMGLAKALDTLFECNSLAVLEQVALEESQASTMRVRARRQARTSVVSVQPTTGSTNFAHFWIWDWALKLLEADYSRRYTNNNSSDVSASPPPFYAMHAAAQVKDCPIPFILLAMRAYPEQVRQVDERTGNLPLHFVAAWDVSDPATVSRKSMALNALVAEYPEGGKVRNRRGKTPMSLALESGTSWDSGIRKLTSFRR